MPSDDDTYDWAEVFDLKIRDRILAGDDEALIHYQEMGKVAELAVPTPEHYLPLLYVLAVRDKEESTRFFVEKMDAAAISMRSFVIGRCPQ